MLLEEILIPGTPARVVEEYKNLPARAAVEDFGLLEALQEKETSGKIQEELTKLGIPYQVLAPNYGIVATIQGSRPGKKIVLRADIDALPVTEETGLSFASEHPGVMHACGHDAHAAMLLGAARILQANKDELCGSVICLFQVAEETGFGYKEALDVSRS